MNGMTIDTLARQLALPTSRRASLLALGVPGLAVMTGFSPATEAKKKRKNNKKKDDKKCKRQVGQCNGVFAPICAEEDAPVDCVEQTGACCAFLDDCQADAFIDCFFALIRPPEPEEDLAR
jgi:hypothetical protein